MRFYRGRGMKLDYYRHHHGNTRNQNVSTPTTNSPETNNNNGRFGIVCVIIVIILFAIMAGVGSCINRKEKEEFQQHIRDTQQEYRDNVQNNLWRLEVKGWKPEETHDNVRFTAFVRNQSGVGVGNVYFILALLDDKQEVIYQKWTSYLVGKDGYFFVRIDIPQKDIPDYSNYKWSMSAEKPLI